MDELLQSIHAAVAADASPDVRRSGASACRTILTSLEATQGHRLEVSPINASQIASVVGALRGVPTDQLLDIAISRLRSMLPTDGPTPDLKPFKCRVIPLPATSPRTP
jgi:hypothetical protein